MERSEKIESLVLEVLSFYEPMSLELILLDMPEDEILSIPEFNREDLESALKILVKKKRVKLSVLGAKKERFWIKAFPKKSLFQRFLRRFNF